MKANANEHTESYPERREQKQVDRGKRANNWSGNWNSLKRWVKYSSRHILLSIKIRGNFMATQRERVCFEGGELNERVLHGETNTFKYKQICWPKSATMTTIPSYIRAPTISLAMSGIRITLVRIMFPYAYILSTWGDLWRKGKQQTNGLLLSERAHGQPSHSMQHTNEMHVRNCSQNTNILYLVSSAMACIIIKKTGMCCRYMENALSETNIVCKQHGHNDDVVETYGKRTKIINLTHENMYENCWLIWKTLQLYSKINKLNVIYDK